MNIDLSLLDKETLIKIIEDLSEKVCEIDAEQVKLMQQDIDRLSKENLELSEKKQEQDFPPLDNAELNPPITMAEQPSLEEILVADGYDYCYESADGDFRVFQAASHNDAVLKAHADVERRGTVLLRVFRGKDKDKTKIWPSSKSA